MIINRKETIKIKVGSMFIGGDAPVSIQSMTNTDTRDVAKTVQQIHNLEEVGCELVRVTVPDMEAAQALGQIKKRISLPLIADIHFNYKYALKAMENGVDKVRINPGNIGSRERVREVARAAEEYGVPIRIGVNAGSLEKRLLEKYGGPTAEALVESALEQVRMLEEFNFNQIIISLKAAEVTKMIKAYELISEKTRYPLHLGVTEAGTAIRAAVKSGVGIGYLLLKGIGDTLRVSITGSPLKEVLAGREILRSSGVREIGPEIISCPTCGRCEIDLISLAEKVEEELETFPHPLKVAIMGCVVNGPGEAREADIGVAGGRGAGVIFKKGEVVKKVEEDKLLEVLMEEIHSLAKDHMNTVSSIESSDSPGESQARTIAIIPAFNEGKTIGNVVSVLKGVSLIDDIIVVSDGSTDSTAKVAKELGVKVIELVENRGKGGAMKAGLEGTVADVILFLDADLLGLTTSHVYDLVQPVLDGDAEMTVGIFGKGRVATDLAQKVAPYLSGQRAVRRSLLENVSGMDMARFGVEVALTRHIETSRAKVIEVILGDMSHVIKEEKLGVIKGLAARAKMYWEIVKFLVRKEHN